MNDNQTLEAFLNFNDTKIKRKQTSFESFSNSSDHSENQKILLSFKQLRTQLKTIQRQNEQLKQKMKISDIKLRQNQEQLDMVLQGNFSLKNQLKKQADSHEELKLKFAQMKEAMSSMYTIQGQLQFAKSSLLQAKLQQQSFAKERAQIMQFSLNEKLKFEQDILRFQAKSKSDTEFIKQLQIQLAKAKESNIKLENQLRKLAITFEEESFNKKWTRENYQTQHLLQKIEEYTKEINSLKQKNKKEKQKRQILEQKLLEFQSLSGVNSIKAEAYENQAGLLVERQAKYVKKISELNKKLQNKNEGMLETQKKLTKLNLVVDQLAFRLKNQTSDKFVEAILEYQQKIKIIMNNQVSSKEAGFVNKQIQESQKVLKQFNQCYYSQKINSCNLKLPESQSKNVASASKNYPNRFTFGFSDQKQNQSRQMVGIQVKIRKERDEMERKIKQKYFQKKIQACMPSEKHRLRSEYITTFINYS